MDLIYKVTDRDLGYDRPVLQQMEAGRFTQFYALRWCNVWATSLAAARAIQRQWRASQH